MGHVIRGGLGFVPEDIYDDYLPPEAYDTGAGESGGIYGPDLTTAFNKYLPGGADGLIKTFGDFGGSGSSSVIPKIDSNGELIEDGESEVAQIAATKGYADGLRAAPFDDFNGPYSPTLDKIYRAAYAGGYAAGMAERKVAGSGSGSGSSTTAPAVFRPAVPSAGGGGSSFEEDGEGMSTTTKVVIGGVVGVAAIAAGVALSKRGKRRSA